MKSKAAQALVPLLVLFVSDVTAQWDNPFPEEAKISYPRGEAPFYVRVRSYARQLGRLFESGMELAMQNEANALGVDAATLGAISAILTQYREREDEASVDGWRHECIPLLRGDAVTDAQAREAFVRRDAEAWRATIADQLLEELESQLGEEVAENVRQHIVTRGEAIMFTRSEFAKVIELGRGGLFLSHMMLECSKPGVAGSSP